MGTLALAPPCVRACFDTVYPSYDSVRVTEFLTALPAADVATLICGIRSHISYTLDPGSVNRLTAACLTLLPLTRSEFVTVEQYIDPAYAEGRAALAVVFSHRYADEKLVQSRALDTWHYMKSADVVLQVASEAGWYYPTAWQLSGFDTEMDYDRFDASLDLAHHVSAVCSDVSPTFGAVVRTLGATWSGTLDELLTTAHALTA